MSKPRAVIILGLQEPGNNDVQLVQALGYQVLLFKLEFSLQEAMLVEMPVEINLNDEEAVIAKALTLQAQYDIRAVFSLNEYRIALAARIAEALHMPNGMPYEAALNCRNKKRTRQLLAEHNLGSAQYALVQSPEEALAALQDFSLPVVIKPSNEAGSNYVTVCHSADAVAAAVEQIVANRNNWVGQVMDADILLEEYLVGPEFSVESCTVKGQTTVLAITAKLTLGAVEVGHVVPAPLSAADEDAIRQLVMDALAALSVADTVTHTEVKLTPFGPRIIEVNARPGGDRIHLLVLAVTGYNLRELHLHASLGGTLEDAPRHTPEALSAAIRFFVAEHAGLISIENEETVKALPAVQDLTLHHKAGSHVEQTTNSYDRLGYVIVHGTTEQNANQVADEVSSLLNITVTPVAEGVTP